MVVMLLKRIKIDIENIASVDQPVDCLTTKKSVKSFLARNPLFHRGFGVFYKTNMK